MGCSKGLHFEEKNPPRRCAKTKKVKFQNPSFCCLYLFIFIYFLFENKEIKQMKYLVKTLILLLVSVKKYTGMMAFIAEINTFVFFFLAFILLSVSSCW